MLHVIPPLAGDFAIIGEIVQQHADDFTAHGFELSEITWKGSDKLGRNPVFKFLNQRTGITIRISFFPAKNGLNGGFVVMILKSANHRLDVEDYLKTHGRDELTKFFTYRAPNTDVRAFAQAFFQTLGGLLNRELAPILRGETWEDTPIDWMGYK